MLDQLGVGGMGVVYAAFDPELDRKVALKLVHAGAGGAKGVSRARLLREAQSMAQLSHPNVAAIYDVGSIDDGIYIAMEHIDGLTLTDWLAAQTRHWREILAVFIPAGRGIEAAHAAGIIHRDLKPDNLMIGRDGRVRVLDFGLARATHSPGGDADASHEGSDGAWSPASSLELKLTAPGLVMGTPMYMAPEQHLGQTVDHRADLYAFCVALWEAVYRQRAFNGRSLAEIAINVIGGRLVEPSGVHVPAWLRAALRRGLARRPSDRFTDMRALLAELGRDRTRRLRWFAGAAVLAGTLGLGAVIARQLGATDALCDDGDAAIAGIWDDDRRAAIAAAFEAEHKAYTAASWANVERTLDGYASALVTMRREACEASRVHGTQSDALMDRRMACLERRTRRLGALTGALAEGGTETMQRAVEAALGLPDLEPCADAQRLMSGVAPPEDAATRGQVEAIQGDLEVLKAQAIAGKLEHLSERTTELVARARATGHPPVVAEALLLRGTYLSNLGDGDESITTLTEGLDVAEIAGHDPIIAEISVVLVLAEGRTGSRFDVAEVYARRAAAVLDRMGDEPRLRLLLASHVGMVANLQHHWAESLVALEQAARIARELGRDDEPIMLPILNATSVALLETGRLDEADATILRALAIIEAQVGLAHPNAGVILAAQARLRHQQDRHEDAVVLWGRASEVFLGSIGADHPNLGAVSNGKGLALAALGRDVEAAAAFANAVAVIERTSGPDHLSLAGGLSNLGAAQTRLGVADHGVAHIRRALSIKLAKLGVNHDELAWNYDLLGDALAANGDTVQAREAYNNAIAVYERRGREGDQDSAYPWLGLGRIARQAGDRTTALLHLERALAVQDPEASADQRGDLRFELALTLEHTDPARARSLADEARVAYVAAGVTRAKRLADVERWLAAG